MLSFSWFSVVNYLLIKVLSLKFSLKTCHNKQEYALINHQNKYIFSMLLNFVCSYDDETGT